MADGSRVYAWKITRDESEGSVYNLWNNEFETIDDFNSAMIESTFDVRKTLFGTSEQERKDPKTGKKVKTGVLMGQGLGTKDMVAKGMPDTVKILEALEVEDFRDLETADHAVGADRLGHGSGDQLEVDEGATTGDSHDQAGDEELLQRGRRQGSFGLVGPLDDVLVILHKGLGLEYTGW